MKSLPSVRILFGIAAAYELLLGLAFLVAGPAIFKALDIPPPNHWGYLHFPAALLVIFGLMFYQIARDPEGRRELVPYGIMLKLAYVLVVGWHWYAGGVPTMWKVLAGFDLAFAVLFFWSLMQIEMAQAAVKTAAAAAPPAVPVH